MRKKRRALTVAAVVLVVSTAVAAVWFANRTGDLVDLAGLAAYAEATRHADPVAGPAGESAERVIYLDQGWSPADSTDFYTRPQGSRLLPYPWFLALEQAGSDRPLRDPANMARLGFLTQRPNPCNPDGLPVGFVKDPRRDNERTDWVGFTCAACHTAELRYNGAAVRIDGGPSAGDMQAFLRELTQALRATLDDPTKFTRFAAAVREKPADLRPRLEDAVRSRQAYEALNATPHPYGPARLDAFGRIVNQLLVTDLGVSGPAQAKPPDAPVSYPFLWDTPHHDFVQWNGVARNAVAGSPELAGLARNVGQVLGVFGEVRVSEPNTATVFTGYRSSARVPDLLHLEGLLRKLQSPQWPAEFPPIDEEKRAAGEALFDRYCARCHAPIDRADTNRTVTAVKTPLRVVGTDPRMATNFAERKGKAGRVEGRKAFFVTGDRFGPEAGADAILVHTVVGVILGSPWGQHKHLDFSELRAGNKPTTPHDEALLVYKARPLNGVWATAPYLHNGSVPTLYDLLLPTAERPRTFFVGRREFDPARVGFRTEAFTGGFVFDTSLPGNSNGGHEYGSGLSEAERRQLVEYLKSL